MSLLFTLALVLGLMTSSVLAQSEQITIVHMAYPGTAAVQAYTDLMIEKFEALHPNVKIEKIMPARIAETEDMFITQIAAGLAPDTIETTLRYGGTFQGAGHFMDLRPFYERDSEISTDTFTIPAMNAMTWPDGSIWGIPRDMFAPTTFYNKDLYAAAGLVAPSELGESGYTWDAFLDAARLLTMDRNGDGEMDQWGMDQNTVHFAYGNPVYQAGGSFFDRQAVPTRSNLLDPKTVAGFEWIVSLYKEYNVAGGAFNQGNAATAFQYSAASIRGLMDAGINIGVTTNPMGPENNGGYYAVNSINVTKYTKNPEWAWEWAKFFAGNAENQKTLVEMTGAVTSHLDVLKDYHEISGHPPQFIDAIVATVTNPNSFHEAIGAGVAEARNLIIDIMVGMTINEDAPARVALEVLSPQVDAVLNR